jgi:ribosomal protein S18 acetylase RimI-like enzyme
MAAGQGFRIAVPSTLAEARTLLVAATPPNQSFTQVLNFSPERIDRALRLGLRKPEWVWAALADDGTTLGVVAGWGAEARETPWILDFLNLPTDRPEVSLALLERAVADSSRPEEAPLEIIHFLPIDSATDDPDVQALIAILDAAGFRMLVRRHRYRMTVAEAELQIPQTSLRFEVLAGPEDPRLVAVLEEILVGSLDAHDLADLAAAELQGGSLHTVAVDTAREYLEFDPADSMFLAIDDSGEVVGLVVGGLRGSPEIGTASFIGVSHRHRGKGYAGQLLGWMTAKLINAGAVYIVGETDDQNFPMANAFEKVGYPHTESRIDFRYRGPNPS